MNEFSKLSEFVKEWHTLPYPKPESVEQTALFTELFLEMLKGDSETVDVEFCGAGAYFGKQVRLNGLEAGPFGYVVPNTCLEVAYDATKLCVYTGDHEGYWVAPFLTLSVGDAEFEKVRELFNKFLKDYFGIV